MLEHDFENSVGFWICSASHVFQKAMNEELAPQGITHRQCQVLGCLAIEGPVSQAELAERMRIEPPTLVGILDRMERDGWIRRAADKHDRRRKLIQPLPAARPVWTKIIAAAERVRRRATAGMTRSQLVQLKQTLKQIQSNLQQHAAKEAS